MAIELETTTLTVLKEERTKQIVIATPKGEDDPTLTIYRERVTSTSDGTVLGIEPVGVVVRTLSDVAKQSFVVGGMTLTGLQIAGILAGVADQLRQEDMAPKPEMAAVSP